MCFLSLKHSYPPSLSSKSYSYFLPGERPLTSQLQIINYLYYILIFGIYVPSSSPEIKHVLQNLLQKMYHQTNKQKIEAPNNRPVARGQIWLVMAWKQGLRYRKRVRAKKESSKDSNPQSPQQKSLVGNFSTILPQRSVSSLLRKLEGEGNMSGSECQWEMRKEAKFSSISSIYIASFWALLLGYPPDKPWESSPQPHFLSLWLQTGLQVEGEKNGLVWRWAVESDLKGLNPRSPTY